MNLSLTDVDSRVGNLEDTTATLETTVSGLDTRLLQLELPGKTVQNGSLKQGQIQWIGPRPLKMRPSIKILQHCNLKKFSLASLSMTS